MGALSSAGILGGIIQTIFGLGKMAGGLATLIGLI